MREGDGKKRIAIIIIGGLLLVAAVIGVTIGIRKSEKKSGNSDGVSAARKAVETICQPTDYKDICKNALEKADLNTDDPRELAKAALDAAVQEINNVTEHSELLKELLMNPKTANATKVCKELFGYAVHDFRRSIDEIKEFDISNMDEILTNLKVWLSATITYEETCIDGFNKDNTTEAGLKVRKMLTTLMRMSSNGLAIVTGMQQAELGEEPNSFEDNDKKDSGHKTRRLMGWSDEYVMGHDGFVDDDLLDEIVRNSEKKRMRMRRRLLNDVIPSWFDVNDRRRKLLEDKKLDTLKPNVTVALDGSGNFTKITEAIAQAPLKSDKVFVIFVKEGVYREQVFIEGKQKNLVLLGAGPTKTIITGNLSADDGTPTFKTCTVAARGDNFMAKDIAFENTAGPEKHQAVAIRVQADKSIFHNCHFIGFQDTLYAHTYRQYYRDCQISGTVDFVFGNAAAFFQNCTFVMRKPMANQQCIMLAQGRKERRQPTGIVLHKSKVIADPEYFPFRFQMKAYLGRPWKEYSKSIIMESFIDDLVQPDGWMPWNTTDFGLNTSYFSEYRNEGPGSNTDRRVKWGGVKTILPSRAESFMPPLLFEGDDWIKASGVPYIPELTTDSSSFTAPPGVVDEDPDNEPPPSDVGDYDDPDSKGKYKSGDSSKDKSSKDSGDSSDDSSKDSDSKKSKDKKSGDDEASGAPAPSPDMLFYQTPGDHSISEPPISWNLGAPSQSPSSMEEPSIESLPPSEPPLSKDLGQDFVVPSESPSQTSPMPAINNERTIIQVSMDEVGGIPSDDEPLTNESLSPISETPSSLDSLVARNALESESPSPMYNLENASMQENPSISVSPSPFVDLENMLMQDKTSTTLKSESLSSIFNPESAPMQAESPLSQEEASIHTSGRMLEQDEPSTTSPSESPSSTFNLESAPMQEEASTTTSERPFSPMANLQESLTEEEPPTSTPSESPSSLVNLEKNLLEAKDIGENDEGVDDASDDNDDHDKFVTSNSVTMDKVLESLHLKTREDLDEIMTHVENQSPETSPTKSPRSIAMSPEKKLRRVLLQSQDNAALAQLASSPESENLLAQSGQSESMAASPEANDLIQQLLLNTTSLSKTPQAKKSDTSVGFKIQFRLCFVALMMIVMLV